MTQSDIDWFIDMLPWQLDVPSAIATFALYELHNQPITLKNGAECHPTGWVRFLGLNNDTRGREGDLFTDEDKRRIVTEQGIE